MPDEIAERLRMLLPDPPCELRHEGAWQLLMATILSAQSTDRMVNRTTRELFRRWPTPAALADAPREEVEEVVRSTGFYRQKARNVQSASARLVEDFGGEVPRTLAELVTLPGVARKTANVVLGTAFGIAGGIAVDTHAKRVANRLGLTAHTDPKKIERDLCDRFDRTEWTEMGHRLVLHGRYVCTARKPDCPACALNERCPSAEAGPTGTIEARAAAERERIESGVAESLGA